MGSGGAALAGGEKVMEPLHAADRRVGFVVAREFLEPFVLDGVARAFGDFSQR